MAIEDAVASQSTTSARDSAPAPSGLHSRFRGPPGRRRVEPNVDVELQEAVVHKGDVYVLCSDGLSDMVEDDDIHLTISTFSANLDTVAKQLIQLANDNGGRDNVSAVMAQVLDAFPANKGIVDKIFRWFG